MDGHIFINKYINVNTIKPSQLPAKLAIGAFCKNCNYQIDYTIEYIQEFGSSLIFLNEKYLTCSLYQIKKLLE